MTAKKGPSGTFLVRWLPCIRFQDSLGTGGSVIRFRVFSSGYKIPRPRQPEKQNARGLGPKASDPQAQMIVD